MLLNHIILFPWNSGWPLQPTDSGYHIRHCSKGPRDFRWCLAGADAGARGLGGQCCLDIFGWRGYWFGYAYYDINIYIYTDGAKPDRAIGRNECGKKKVWAWNPALESRLPSIYSSHTIWLTGLILNSPMCYFALILYIYIRWKYIKTNLIADRLCQTWKDSWNPWTRRWPPSMRTSKSWRTLLIRRPWSAIPWNSSLVLKSIFAIPLCTCFIVNCTCKFVDV